MVTWTWTSFINKKDSVIFSVQLLRALIQTRIYYIFTWDALASVDNLIMDAYHPTINGPVWLFEPIFLATVIIDSCSILSMLYLFLKLWYQIDNFHHGSDLSLRCACVGCKLLACVGHCPLDDEPIGDIAGVGAGLPIAGVHAVTLLDQGPD